MPIIGVITNDENGFNIIFGDPDFNDAVMNVQINPTQISLFAQDDGGTNISQIAIQPTLISALTNGVAKRVATISVTDDFADDAAAATGGIAIGSLYHSSGTVKVRLA